MKRAIVLIACVLSLGLSDLGAQIPADVTNVMNKCRAAMSNHAGIEYEMEIKTKMGPVTIFTMHVVDASKGAKTRSTTKASVMGEDIVMEFGFDGSQEWQVKHSAKRDTVFISKSDKNNKSDNALDLNVDRKYRKAKMKIDGDYYVITFTEPKDSSNEAKSVTVKVAAKSHYVREIKTGARGAKVTMTIGKIRKGLTDEYFKLDLGKYPNAVVVRK